MIYFVGGRGVDMIYPATDILHPPAYEDGTDKEFSNVGYQDPDAGESPKKEQSTR